MDNNTPKPPQNQLAIELTPATKVSYSNLAIISHSRSDAAAHQKQSLHFF